MKKLACFLWLMLCATLSVSAQTFLDHVKKREAGMGVVTVTQSKEIDDLVNGRAATKATTQPQEKNEAMPKSAGTTQKPDKEKKETKSHTDAIQNCSHKKNPDCVRQ